MPVTPRPAIVLASSSVSPSSLERKKTPAPQPRALGVDVAGAAHVTEVVSRGEPDELLAETALLGGVGHGDIFPAGGRRRGGRGMNIEVRAAYSG